jgi:hypothetical protein
MTVTDGYGDVSLLCFWDCLCFTWYLDCDAGLDLCCVVLLSLVAEGLNC